LTNIYPNNNNNSNINSNINNNHNNNNNKANTKPFELYELAGKNALKCMYTVSCQFLVSNQIFYADLANLFKASFS
jgi:purine-nucleoside phosphorylase